MTVVAGPFFAGAGLLAAAGALKVARPGSTLEALRAARLPGTRPTGRWGRTLWVGRLLGSAELAIATAALAVGGRLAAALVVACYLGFAWFSARLLRVAGAGESCGCFGADESPATPVHVGVNLGIAAAAALAVGWPTAGLGSVLGRQPLAGLPFLGITALCGWLLFVMLTVVPEWQQALAEDRHDLISSGRGRHRSGLS